MSIFTSLNIAASSLRTQQKAIDVISHNMANVNTPGYSRQVVDIVTATPESIGGLDFGRGVDLRGIVRKVDSFLVGAEIKNSAQLSFFQSQESGLNTVENVFGSLDAPGLTSALDGFFQAMQSLANNPQDQAHRTNVRGRGEELVIHVAGMRDQLIQGQLTADNKIDVNIQLANKILDEVASLNNQIRIHETSQSGNANDLRDRRDTIVKQLSGIIPVQRVSTGGADEYMLQTMGGDLLVQGETARHLARGTVTSTGFNSIVSAETGNIIQGLDKGGELGGLIVLRDQQFGNYIKQIDGIAANLVFGVNQLHSNGAGLTLVSTATSGQGSTDPLGATVAVDLDTGVPFAAQVGDGQFSIHVYDPTGTPLLAGGSPVTITAGITTLSDIATQINAVAGVTASVSINGQLVIDGGLNQVAFGGDTSNFLAAYEVNAFFHGGNSASFTLDAAVTANASHIAAGIIDPTTSQLQPGDNSIALAMLGLQDSKLSFDGSTAASLHERSASLASGYGLDVATARQQRQFREAEADSLASQRQSVSGVDMDEELISMIEHQRAYEASSKVIQVTNQMLDSLMGLIR
ncbi:MAG: flagellar hook-associated protein FlgK [Mariprofundaceae bacterium]